MNFKKIKEWDERNETLVQEMDDYEVVYHKKICSNCSEAEQKRRCCIIYHDGYRTCEHLENAKNKKFGSRIKKELFSLLKLNGLITKAQSGHTPVLLQGFTCPIILLKCSISRGDKK